MRKKEYIKISAAAAVLAAGIALGGISGLASSSSSVRIGYGPVGSGNGVQTQIVDSNQGIGPSVRELTLSQTYHSDYKTYELSMNNQWFFYSNVGNGDITDQPVRLEIPTGISYTVEKDGRAYEMDAAAPVTEYGTYVLTLTTTEDDTKPFSEQIIYKATFRFRIQDKPLETAPEGGLDGFSGISGAAGSSGGTGTGSGSGTGSAGSSTGSGSGSAVSPTMSLEEALAIVSGAGYSVEETTAPEESTGSLPGLDDELPPPPEGEEESSAAEESGAAEESSAAEETESSGAAGIMGDDGRVDEEALDQTIESLVGPGYGADHLEDFNDSTGLESVFDTVTGYYKHTLASDASFYTNVPNGMICTNSVTVLTNDEIDFRVLKDGEEIEYTVGTPIAEPGSYVVLPSQETSVYASTYYNRKAPEFAFRILGSVVRDLGVYAAPENAVITRVMCGEEEINPAWVHDTWAYLGLDGVYTVDMDTEAGAAEVSFRRDTAAPMFMVMTTKSEANIAYKDEDSVQCVLTRKGEVIHSGNLVSQVSDPGDYTLTVYDEAGNYRSVSFKLSYRMNTGAIIVVLLVAALVLAGVLFVKRISRQLKVR